MTPFTQQTHTSDTHPACAGTSPQTRVPHAQMIPAIAALTAAAGLMLASCGNQDQSGDGAAGGQPGSADETAGQGAGSAQDGSAQHENTEEEEATGAWPRTVTLGDQQIELEAPPENIVALTTETGDIALELAGPDRVAAVASGSTTEGSGNAVELAEEVEVTLPPGTTPEPEQILSHGPDLVLMTGRHDGEEDAAEVLQSSGVPALVFSAEDFTTPQAVADSVRVLGEALGEEEEAEERASQLEEQVTETEAAVAESDESPRVLAMMARGDQIMITGTTSTLSVLAEMAGGTAVADEQGWTGTVPADAELLLAAAPDVILIEDFRGTGLEPFNDILEAEAVASVPAIAENKIHVIPSSIASGAAGLYLGDGLETVAGVLHPELEIE